MEQQKENEMEARGLNGYVGLRLWDLIGGSGSGSSLGIQDLGFRNLGM